MDTKLTLKLNKNIVEKKYDDIQISPFVKSMSSGVNIPANLDYKSEYSNYLTEKYK